MHTGVPDERLSKYELIRPLGEGGMGVVYLARDTILKREVAIKFVSAERLSDPGAERRLVREAQAAAALDHPCICAVYDVQAGLDGRTFIVMQYVEGETLAAQLRRGPLSPRQALSLTADIADALAVAHPRGIVHRDLKPQNIMITPSGRPKLLDFGIAQVRIPLDVADVITRTSTATLAPGAIMGTPAYMSPEQIREAAGWPERSFLARPRSSSAWSDGRPSAAGVRWRRGKYSARGSAGSFQPGARIVRRARRGLPPIACQGAGGTVSSRRTASSSVRCDSSRTPADDANATAGEGAGWRDSLAPRRRLRSCCWPRLSPGG